MNTKYKIVYADPPWKYGSKELYGDKIMGYKNGQRRRFAKLERKYPTMKLQGIKNLPIKNIIDKDCICFMWVTDSHLKEGIEVLESWGFKYKTIGFNWIKHYDSGAVCFNFAPWTLKSWEICLIGTRGTMGKYKQLNNIKGLLVDKRIKHSQKPAEARKRIELLFGDIPRIELFARQKTEGWDVWGNEVESDIDFQLKKRS